MIVRSEEEIFKILFDCKHADSETLENEDVEFKEYRSLSSLHNSKELAEEISALANKKGGVVIVGVKDGSNVVKNNWNPSSSDLKKVMS
jgi:ATP-dependent DNA helicase RecG